MTSEEKFIRLIHKFDCAVAQLKHRGLTPSYNPIHWGLTVDSKKTYAIRAHNNCVNPFSIILEGIRVNEKIFGNRSHIEYQGYCNGYYPYLEIQRIFNLPGFLQSAFSE